MNYIFIYCLTYKDAVFQALQISIQQQTAKTEIGVEPRAIWDFYPNFQCGCPGLPTAFKWQLKVALNSAKAFLAILRLLLYSPVTSCG